MWFYWQVYDRAIATSHLNKIAIYIYVHIYVSTYIFMYICVVSLEGVR